MIKCKTTVMKEPLSAEDVTRLAAAIKACKILAFPTDTVYGLGATGLVKAAARRIYQIKGRPTLKPLPIFVESLEAAKRWVEWTPAAEALARKFWPGALTLVLRPTEEGRLLTFAEYQTVALRVPNHAELLKIIAATGLPWVSTSANVSGSPSLKTGEEVAKQFEGLVDFVVDGGTTPGVESSLVDVTSIPIRILREGAVPSKEIFDALGQSV